MGLAGLVPCRRGKRTGVRFHRVGSPFPSSWLLYDRNLRTYLPVSYPCVCFPICLSALGIRSLSYRLSQKWKIRSARLDFARSKWTKTLYVIRERSTLRSHDLIFFLIRPRASTFLSMKIHVHPKRFSCTFLKSSSLVAVDLRRSDPCSRFVLR